MDLELLREVMSNVLEEEWKGKLVGNVGDADAEG